jgi:predicted nucleic acid-binding protein
MVPQIVIDTNVVYAALYSRFGASRRLMEKVGKGVFDFHLSIPLVLQYEDVLKRADGLEHKIYYTWRPFLPDAKDDLVMELAIAASCTEIVTHNVRDFQGCETFGVKAVKPLQFLKSIGV